MSFCNCYDCAMARQQGHWHPRSVPMDRPLPGQGHFHHGVVPAMHPSGIPQRPQPHVHFTFNLPHPQWMHHPMYQPQQPVSYPVPGGGPPQTSSQQYGTQFEPSRQLPHPRPAPPMQYLHPGQHPHPVHMPHTHQFPGQFVRNPACPQHGIHHPHRHMAMPPHHHHGPAPPHTVPYPSNQAQPSHNGQLATQGPPPNWSPQLANAFQAGFSAARLSQVNIANTDLARSLQEYVATMPRDQRQRMQKKPNGYKVEKNRSGTNTRGVKVTVFNTTRNGSTSAARREEVLDRVKQEMIDLENGENEMNVGVKIKREPVLT